MKRFLPLLILSNILLGQGITNSLISYLPELTEYPKSKYVLVENYKYKESFGEFSERRDSSHSVFLFDDKGRNIKEWDYDSKTLADILTWEFFLIAKDIDTSKIIDYSTGLIKRQTYFYEKDNTLVYSKKNIGYKSNKENDRIYKVKYDAKGFRSLSDVFDDTGKLIERSKSEWVDKNTLIFNNYSGKDGKKVNTGKNIYNDGMLISSSHNYTATKILPSYTTQTIYSYVWENDTLLSVSEIFETDNPYELAFSGDSVKISKIEVVFNNNGLLKSHKVSTIEEKFGELTKTPQRKEKYSYFNSLNELYDYRNEAIGQKGSLDLISEPSGLMVSIDGRKTDYVTPAIIEGLSSRLHFVSLENENYFGVYSLRIGIRDTVSVKYFVDPKTGSLKIKSVPYASVNVDGQYISGGTPTTIKNLSVGKHRILLTKNGYKEKELIFDIASPKEYSIEMSLDKDEESAKIIGLSYQEKLDYFRNKDIQKAGKVDSIIIKAERNSRLYKYSNNLKPDLGVVDEGEKITAFKLTRDGKVLIRRTVGPKYRSKYGYVIFRKIGIPKEFASEGKKNIVNQ